MKFVRLKPINMLFYEVLLRRAIVDHKVKRELEIKYNALRTGYVGERRVDNEWREVNVKGVLLHDFTCRNAVGNTHQMDTVFICKHFILVVEIKNVTGRIDFDDVRRQFLRTREDGRVESFNNPIDQVKRHRDLFLEVSIDWPFYVPVEAFVVIANPSTVIGRISSEVPVFNVSGLRTKVQELVKKHAALNLNIRVVRGLIEELYEPIEQKMKINYPIRNGVICERCGKVMVFNRGFICTSCGWQDKDGVALRKAMYDYRVLYGHKISNRQFREYVGVLSMRTASHILKKIAPETIGKNKGTMHLIPENLEKDIRNRKIKL